MDRTTSENSGADNEGARGVMSFLATAWRGRYWIVGLIVLGGVVGLLLETTQPTIYTAQVTMLPQQEDSHSNLLSRLALFTGVYVGTEISFEDLYTRIVQSDRLLDPLVDHHWTSGTGGREIDLYELFDVDRTGEADPVARESLKIHLRKDVVIFSRDARTGFMTLEVRVPEYPHLAADMANALADALDEFNLDFRGSKAMDQRKFVQLRLESVRASLDSANAALTGFIEANRTYNSAPALKQQYRDLEREVEAETTVWLELRRQLELARIEEGKPLTTITILDHASPPVEPSGLERTEHVLVGMLLGLLAAVVGIAAVSIVDPRS